MQVVEKTGIIYCRVSSLDQLEGTSLESQERVCREYAEHQGITILQSFIERGESAKTADRTELKKAIAFCKQKRAAFFVVYKLDRFSRNQEDHVTIRALLRRSGTELRSATEPIDDSPVGRAMEGILSVFAEFDNNVRTERTKQGMLERVKQGFWCWPVPLGYLRPALKSNITPDPKSAPLIRLAFEEYSKGTYTFKALASFLASKGLRSVRGSVLRFQTIEKILRNPLYAGSIEVWGQRFPGSFESVIPLELFERCQGDPKSRSPHAAPRSANNPLFPLRGVVVCSDCGWALTGSSSTNRQGIRYPYYHHGRQGCPRACFHPKEEFERLFTSFLEEIGPTPLFESLFREVVLDFWKKRASFQRDRNQTARREIERLEQERQRVFQYHRHGVYSDQDFEEQKQKIEKQIHEKSLLVEEGADRKVDIEKAIESMLARARDPARTWTLLEPKYMDRLQFQKWIFNGKVQFDGSRFGTRNLSLIYQLNRDYQGEKSTLVALVRAQWNLLVDDLSSWVGTLED